MRATKWAPGFNNDLALVFSDYSPIIGWFLYEDTWRSGMRVIASRAGRLIGRSLGLPGLARAYTRTRRRKRAHTGVAHAEAQSQLYARPLELHSFIKVARADVRVSRRVAPRRALLSPRSAFYERNVYSASLSFSLFLSRWCIYAHAHTPTLSGVPERNCVLMAAIAIDARSKFKRIYFPHRCGVGDGAVLLLLYHEYANGTRIPVATWKKKKGKWYESSSYSIKFQRFTIEIHTPEN